MLQNRWRIGVRHLLASIVGAARQSLALAVLLPAFFLPASAQTLLLPSLEPCPPVWDPNHPIFKPIWLDHWQTWLPRYSEDAWQDLLWYPEDKIDDISFRLPWQPYPPSQCIPRWFPPRWAPPQDWTPPSSENEAIYLGSGTGLVDGAGSVCAVPVASPLLAATGQTGFRIPAPATSFGHGGWTHVTSPTPGGTWLSQLYSWDRIQIVRVRSRGRGTPIEDYRNSNLPEPVYEYILYDANGTASPFYERVGGRFEAAFGVEAKLLRNGDTFTVIGGPPWAIHRKGAWRYGFTGMPQIDSPPNQPWGRGQKATVLFIRDPLGNLWERVNDLRFPQSVCWRAPNLTLMRFDSDGRVYYSENVNPPEWQLIGKLEPNAAGGRPQYGNAGFTVYEADGKHVAFQWSSRVVRNTETSLLSEMRLEAGTLQQGYFSSQISKRWLFEKSTDWREELLYQYLYGEPSRASGFLGRLVEEQVGNHYKTQLEFRYLQGRSASETQIYREQTPINAKTSLVHRWNSETNKFSQLEVFRPRLYNTLDDNSSTIFREKEVVRLSEQNGNPIERVFYAFATDSTPTWREEYRYEYAANPDVMTAYVDRQGNEYRWEYEEREARRWHPEIPMTETVLKRAVDPTGVSVSLNYGETWNDFEAGWRYANPPLLASSVQLGENSERRWRFQYSWSESLTPSQPNGLLSGFAEPGRQWWKFFYTPAWFRQPFQLYMVLDPTGRSTRITNWDELGRPTRFEAYPERSGSGPLYQEVKYTDFGLVKEVRSGFAHYAPQAVKYIWNGLQLQEFIDARGRSARFEYVPGSGELSRIDLGDSLYAQLGYDYFGRLSRVAGGNGVGVSYEYGYRDELIRIRHDGDANPERFYYSSCCGQVSLWVRPNEQQVGFDYTPNGWLQEAYIQLGLGQRQRLAYYEYDSAGRLTLARDPITTTTFRYDTQDGDRTGWLESSTVQLLNLNNATYEFRYTYYPNGDVQTGQLSGADFTSSQGFTYDDAGRLISQSYTRQQFLSSVNLSVNYEYDGAGRLTKQSVQVGTDKLETYIAYADHQSVGSVWWFNTYLNNSPKARFTYTYYPDGTVASVDETVGSASTQWRWDYHPDGSLAYEESSSLPDRWRRDYTYDPGGNLLRLPTLANVVPQYQHNQLRSAGSWAFTYTPNGERATEQNNPVAGYQGNWNYVYDVWGNLTQVYRNGQLVYEAKYDAFGNRVWAKVGGQERYYLYEGDTLVAELDANGVIIAEYVWGLLGPVARVSAQGVQLYVLDGLGHVRALVGRVDGSWRITDTYAYDSWGNLIGRRGETNQPFTWNGSYGYEYIPATGLYHVGAREYDPRTGRWLQRDPIDAASGDPNLYRYAENDPVNFCDANGVAREQKQPTQTASETARKPITCPTCGGDGIICNGVHVVPGPGLFDVSKRAQLCPDCNMTGTIPEGGWKGPAIEDLPKASSPEASKLSPEERKAVNDLGRKYGCHTCGAKDPGTKDGSFIPDHIPPSKAEGLDCGVLDASEQHLAPHCKTCAARQGGNVAQANRRAKEWGLTPANAPVKKFCDLPSDKHPSQPPNRRRPGRRGGARK